VTTSIAGQDASALGGSGSILLRQRRDHAELDRMMNRYRSAGSTPAEREALWHDIVQLVFSHAFAEETVLWPVLRRIASDGEELTTQVEQEHQAISDLMARVEKAGSGDARRDGWISEAFELIREDIRDEEDALLPRMRDALSARQLQRIGAGWEAVRRTAPTHPHPAVARRPPDNVLRGVPLSVVDRVRDAAPATGPAGRRITVLVAGVGGAALAVAIARRALRR
jgi:hypothetical protein